MPKDLGRSKNKTAILGWSTSSVLTFIMASWVFYGFLHDELLGPNMLLWFLFVLSYLFSGCCMLTALMLKRGARKKAVYTGTVALFLELLPMSLSVLAKYRIFPMGVFESRGMLAQYSIIFIAGPLLIASITLLAFTIMAIPYVRIAGTRLPWKPDDRLYRLERIYKEGRLDGRVYRKLRSELEEGRAPPYSTPKRRSTS